MTSEENIPAWAWKLALAATAAIWGGSFVVMKDTLNVVSPSWLMFLRFSLAALIVGAVFWRRVRPRLDRAHLAAGAVLGLVYGAAFVVQNIGLTGTTPGRNAFLTATYSVMVPFIDWAVCRRRPGAQSIVAAVLAVCGVGLLSLGDDLGLGLGVGDSLTLVCAVLFAVHIVLASRFAKEGLEVMSFTVVQLAASAAAALVCGLVIEPGFDFAVLLNAEMLWPFFYLVVLSSCVCMVLQNLGQAHVPVAQAGLLLSLESVFAVVASVVFYGEELTPRLALGFAAIFVAVVVSEVGGAWLGKRAERRR